MHIGPKNPKLAYHKNDTVLIVTETIKDPGIHIFNDLS